MILQVRKGDLFAPENLIIGHGVNTVGVMGAGIAKTFHKLFPDNFLVYQDVCKNKLFKPGMVLVVEEKGRVIANIASQDYPGPCARTEWIREGLVKFHNLGYTNITLPWIGCGIGGLQRADVAKVLEESPLSITLCEL